MTTQQRRKMTRFRIDELSNVDRPAQAGATVVLMKRAERAGEKAMPTIDDLIKRATEPAPDDTPRERNDKRLVKAQLDAGVVSPAAVAAETAIQSYAKLAAERDKTLSHEQAYVKALREHPDLADAATPPPA